MGFSAFYNTIFVQPLLNGLAFLTNIMPFHDVGLAIVVLTLAVRFIIFPFTHRSIKTQVKMKQLEPELKTIKDKFKDKQEQAKRTMELYRKHGVSPFSGCLILLIQLPILFALFYVFRNGVNFDPQELYSFIKIPDVIQERFLGLIDINQRSIFFAVLTGISQFIQMRLSIPPSKNKPKKSAGPASFKDDLSRSMSFQAKYILPGFIFFITLRLPAAIAIYWTTMNLFAIVHESIVRKKAKKIYGNSKNGDSKGQFSNKEVGRDN
jgi:YidC/Oxa1 family membrane protein insertase